jgi:tetratricopeptide (TPR) repeat protein
MMAKNSSPKKRAGCREQKQRDLDIEIGFIEGVIRRDPTYVEALLVLGDDYTRRGRFVDGLKIDQQLARLRPDDALVHYNLACSYSLTDQIQLAFSELETAIRLGYRDYGWLARDPDLRKLRKHPLYQTIRVWLHHLKNQAP